MQSIKEHNLKANHNPLACILLCANSVCNLSKNTIWKQITTPPTENQRHLYLYAIYQRTQFESKSQHLNGLFTVAPVCMQSIKEHNLKANHNNSPATPAVQTSVCNLSKNTIWKQITTLLLFLLFLQNLYAIYQRTQFESKSQRKKSIRSKRNICMQSIKEHNLKANHNQVSKDFNSPLSVCNLSKNTIWKQITTIKLSLVPRLPLYAIYQRTQFESKSQRISERIITRSFCMQSIKEHNLKANHNFINLSELEFSSVCNLSKNTIWKQITTVAITFGVAWICMQSIKEHNLKANHNHRWRWTCISFLYAIYQRTQFESKSQPKGRLTHNRGICMQSIKEHNLKANHNLYCYLFLYCLSVCNLSKNTIWKQITTLCLPYYSSSTLYAIYQRTQFESKSQHPQWRTRSPGICMQSIKEHNLKANHNEDGKTRKKYDSVCNLSKNTIWKQITTVQRV